MNNSIPGSQEWPKTSKKSPKGHSSTYFWGAGSYDTMMFVVLATLLRTASEFPSGPSCSDPTTPMKNRAELRCGVDVSRSRFRLRGLVGPSGRHGLV